MSHQICSEKLTSLSQNSLPLITHTTNTEQIHKILQTKSVTCTKGVSVLRIESEKSSGTIYILL